MVRGRLVRQIFLDFRSADELHEMVYVILGVYAKLHGSMFLYLSVKSMCVFRARYADYMAK